MDAQSEQQIAELTSFFVNIDNLPKELQLYPGTRITDLPKFIETHLTLLSSGISSAVQAPVMDRILKLKDLLKGNASLPAQ